MSHLDALLNAGSDVVSLSGKIAREEAEQLKELLQLHGIGKSAFVSAAILDALQRLNDVDPPEQIEKPEPKKKEKK